MPRGPFRPFYAAGQRDQRRAAADQIAPEVIRQGVEHGIEPLENVIDRLSLEALPPQLVQSSYLVRIESVGASGAVLLIPRNPRRLSYIISNFQFSQAIIFAFGKCIDNGANEAAGVAVGPYFMETNGSVSTDDIWVACNDSTETFPITILGYEGGISVAGNRQR